MPWYIPKMTELKLLIHTHVDQKQCHHVVYSTFGNYLLDELTLYYNYIYYWSNGLEWSHSARWLGFKENDFQ